MEWLFRPWPWYLSGPMIALVMFLLLMMGKNFGMSGNLRTICTLCGGEKASDFFRFDWRSQKWNLMVVLGAIIGGFMGNKFLSNDISVKINPKVAEQLKMLGFESVGSAYLPEKLFSISSLGDIRILAILVIGGFLVGFGARYAGGCTSGHAISGLSELQWPSLLAVIGFFIGGLLMVHLIFPILF